MTPGEDKGEGRPRAGIQQFSTFESALELLALGGMLVCVLIVALNYSTLPARIPMHFDAAGAVDRYGHKSELWLLAGLAVVLCLINWAIARFIHRLRDARQGISRVSIAQLRLARKLVLMLNAGLALTFVIALEQTVRLGRGLAEKLDVSGIMGMLVLMGLTLSAYIIAAVRLALQERAERQS